MRRLIFRLLVAILVCGLATGLGWSLGASLADPARPAAEPIGVNFAPSIPYDEELDNRLTARGFVPCWEGGAEDRVAVASCIDAELINAEVELDEFYAAMREPIQMPMCDLDGIFCVDVEAVALLWLQSDAECPCMSGFGVNPDAPDWEYCIPMLQ